MGRNRYEPGALNNTKDAKRNRMLEILTRNPWLSTQSVGLRAGLVQASAAAALLKMAKLGLVEWRQSATDTHGREWRVITTRAA